MARHAATLLTGLLFGFGLGLSGMVDRSRIIGFLDVFGAWDPTLLYVMAGAAGTTLLTFRLILRRKRPVLENAFFLGSAKAIDRPLVVGAGVFGVGWGIAGYCPGPGLAALALGSWTPVVFLAAVSLGSYLHYVSSASAGPAAGSDPCAGGAAKVQVKGFSCS